MICWYHLNSITAKEMKELPLGESQAEKVIITLTVEDTEKLRNIFINCHSLAFKGTHYTDFVWLIQMDMQKNMNIGKIYTNDKGAHAFTRAIAQVEREKVIDTITSSKFTAVLVDGPSDVSVVENEIVCVCVCSRGNPKVLFAHSAQVSEGRQLILCQLSKKALKEA